MKRIVLPCNSPNPDRDLDEVVVQFGDQFPVTLGYYRRTFDQTRLGLVELYSFEIINPAIELFAVKDDEGYSQDQIYEPTAWDSYLKEMELDPGKVALTPALPTGASLYLVVVKDGFHITWDGADRHTDAELYESHRFTLDDITTLERIGR